MFQTKSKYYCKIAFFFFFLRNHPGFRTIPYGVDSCDMVCLGENYFNTHVVRNISEML